MLIKKVRTTKNTYLQFQTKYNLVTANHFQFVIVIKQALKDLKEGKLNKYPTENN